MGKLILTLLGALIIMIGVTMLFDARKIATKPLAQEKQMKQQRY